MTNQNQMTIAKHLGCQAILSGIQHRQKPNDIFHTPPALALKHIQMTECAPGEVRYDPFRSTGNYYNQFPANSRKEWSEIEDGRDFFEFQGDVGVICSNPPYSLINRCLDKCVELQPRVISLLIGCLNLSMARIRRMASHGYHIRKVMMADVRNWFGASKCVEWVKSDTPITATLEFDFTPHKGTAGGDAKIKTSTKTKCPTVKQLQAQCCERGLKVSGKKAELIERLDEAFADLLEEQERELEIA